MPNERGKLGHGTQRKALAALTLLIPIATLRLETAALPVGVLLGKWFNPDQDAWNKWGPVEGAFGMDIFRKEIPHRGKASHTVGISGILLFAPILGVIGIISYVAGIHSPFFWWCIFWLSVGVILDNSLHIIADRIESAIKRTKNKLKGA